MGLHRTHRKDRNHDEIVTAFRQLGASVVSTANVGNGFPDLVVGHGRRTILVEIKPTGRGWEEKQLRFLNTWAGAPPVVCREPEDAAVILGAAP